MNQLIIDIANVFNILGKLKGVNAGYSSSDRDKMIIDYKGERYIVTFTKIEEPNEDIFKDLNKYLG